MLSGPGGRALPRKGPGFAFRERLEMLPANLYVNYAELTALLEGWARAFPDRLRLDSLGKSHQGRDIWCLTVTRFATGEARDKPALWVDGNIHATELSATSACLHLVSQLIEQDDQDPAIKDLLDKRAFYVVPRVCPDGAELAFARPPRYVRSSMRPYPFEEPTIEGWETMDVDDDGRILTLRIPDPHGPWKVCAEEPRLLVRRAPEDREGPFYRCLPEGRFVQDDWDGVTIKAAPLSEQLDLNRNFPLRWRQEFEQKGAGPYPVSEPEVKALVDFLVAHPNVCHAITYHTFSGVFLRPYSNEPDEALAYKAGSPVWFRSDYSDNRARVEWVVKGPAGATVSADVRHDRCGRLSVQWVL